MLTGEPAVVVGAIVAALNAVQGLALDIPDWTHALIAVATVVLGALVTRAKVTPTVKAT